MIERELVLQNKYGLHARPATLLAELANRFASEIQVEKDGQVVNGKSIFELIMLAAEKGSRLRVRAEGEDAEAALAAIAELIDARFHEE
ncbi:MAG: HPr family phosphocarrier protein [Planctomycetota bacterium]|nr:MAG: HPr family phosphocarrier protein [Planctomycetota bacterium]